MESGNMSKRQKPNKRAKHNNKKSIGLKRIDQTLYPEADLSWPLTVMNIFLVKLTPLYPLKFTNELPFICFFSHLFNFRFVC